MSASKQWQLARDVVRRYEEILVPTILGPAARLLVDVAETKDGEHVLDVGCGTGAAARFAAQRAGPSGRVMGIDVNEGMIETAKALPAIDGANMEWQIASAYEIRATDDEFDVVLCAQTLQFLDDPKRALNEMHRVVKPGGRVCVSAWSELAGNPYFDALVQSISRHIGDETAAGLQVAFALSDRSALDELVTTAGFEEVTLTTGEFYFEPASIRDFVPNHVSATPMAAGFAAATDAQRSAVVDDVVQAMTAYGTDGGFRIPFRTHLVTATRT